MNSAPQSPAQARPGGEPYYIGSKCPDCGSKLTLYDLLPDEAKKSINDLPNRNAIWHDEWVCPECLDGIHMDWPLDLLEAINDPDYSSVFEPSP